MDDVFDLIAYPEEQISRSSYNKGFVEGRSSGLTEGYHTGYHQGFAIGQEIGYYAGFVVAVTESELDIITDKVKRIVVRLKELLEIVPSENLPDFDSEVHLQNIRALYKNACSLLGTSSALPTHLKLSY